MVRGGIAPSVIALLAVFSLSQVARAEDLKDERVVGAWRLVHTEMKAPDGRTFPNPMYGANPHGYLIYDQSHTMCVFLAAANPYVPPPEGISLSAMTVPPKPATYCGRWHIDHERNAIIHSVEVSLGVISGDQVRRAQLNGDTLIIRSPTPAGLADAYLQFERVK